MTTTEIINILRDTCTGKYFSSKDYADDGDFIFTFTDRHEEYQLKVKTDWVIDMFGEMAYSSRASNRGLHNSLITHPGAGVLKVAEISITSKYELGFRFGNMGLTIPVSKQTSKNNPAYWEQVLPEWVFTKGDKILASSPKRA